MTRNLFGTLALAALAAFSVSTAAAQELIQIGDDGALEVPVREGSDERVALTPVLIEKDETGQVVSVRSAIDERDLGYLFGIQYSVPLRVSVSAGLVIGNYDGNGVRGWLVEGELGQGGAAVSFGRGYAAENASAMQLTVLHTFGNPLYVDRGNSYVGVRQMFSFFSIKIVAGYMYRVAGSPGAGRWLTTFGGGVTWGDLWERERRR